MHGVGWVAVSLEAHSTQPEAAGSGSLIKVRILAAVMLLYYVSQRGSKTAKRNSRI
jgi:hypothetical protein